MPWRYKGRPHALAMEYFLECLLHDRGAGARGACDGNYRVFFSLH